MRVYAESIKGGLWPTVYTLTSIVNACVRCGELDRAQNYLREMETAGIKANEVLILNKKEGRSAYYMIVFKYFFPYFFVFMD